MASKIACATRPACPNALTEIADAVAASNPDHTAAVLSQFRRLGVTTALDNFGSNSLSLASLRRCAYDVLKIDRSLISSMQADRVSQDVVGMILTLAGKLGCEVIAEGIEKPAKLKLSAPWAAVWRKDTYFLRLSTPTRPGSLRKRCNRFRPATIEIEIPRQSFPIPSWSLPASDLAILHPLRTGTSRCCFAAGNISRSVSCPC